MVLPPIPEENDPVKDAVLTKEKAPPAPTNISLPPPLDKAVIKRNSILVPPPPSVPQLRELLLSGIKNLYKSKIPKPPQNLPVPPPLPQSELDSLTKLGAPEAPKTSIPPLDPQIRKRNSILVPLPQQILKLPPTP